MFRASITRAASSAIRVQPAVRVFHPSVTRFVRFESSQPSQPDAAEAAQKRADDLSRDWDARVITYAELKPKTESPDPVST